MTGQSWDLSTHGWCPHCRRFIRLTKAGVLWHHGGPLGTGYARGGRSRCYCCPGAGGKPALLGDVEVDTETLAPSGELTR